jgi:hypothetical protein
MNRETDLTHKVYFRADRFHRSDGEWYFLTREGINVGPFESKERAEGELANYLGVEMTPTENS